MCIYMKKNLVAYLSKTHCNLLIKIIHLFKGGIVDFNYKLNTFYLEIIIATKEALLLLMNTQVVIVITASLL